MADIAAQMRDAHAYLDGTVQEPETFETLHGTTVAVGARATEQTGADLAALLAFHHWRDFFRGRSAHVKYDPDVLRRVYNYEGERLKIVQASYIKHWYSPWVECAR